MNGTCDRPIATPHTLHIGPYVEEFVMVRSKLGLAIGAALGFMVACIAPPSLGFESNPEPSIAKESDRADGPADEVGRSPAGEKKRPSPAAEKPARRAPRLNRKELEVIEAVAAAHVAGNQSAILELLAPLASRLKAERTAIVEAALSDRSLPSMGRMLVDARMTMIEQGWVESMPKITPREAVFLLPAFDAYVADLIAPPAIEGSEPDLAQLEKFERYEAILWKLHVRRNRAESARRVVEYAGLVRSSFNDRQLARLTEQERALFQGDTQAARRHVEMAVADIEDRAAEARLARLVRAHQVLDEPRLTAERYLAAYTWRLDAGRLHEYFHGLGQTQPPRQPTRPVMAATDLASVDALAAECEIKAGDLTQRAEWLLEGLHWWLRGRYGAGTEVFGLAKSQQALASPMALFPLMMPVDTPRPTPPGTSYSISEARPFYDRRHHYWWAWEDRGVVSTANTQETSRSQNYQDWCSNGYFY